MISFFSPHLQLETVLDLDRALLRSFGLRGLLLDVACTLKNYGATEFPTPVRAWVTMLQTEGMRLCLLSNGKPRRIGELARQLDLPFVAQAFNPLPRGCNKSDRQRSVRPHHWCQDPKLSSLPNAVDATSAEHPIGFRRP